MSLHLVGSVQVDEDVDRRDENLGEDEDDDDPLE